MVELLPWPKAYVPPNPEENTRPLSVINRVCRLPHATSEIINFCVCLFLLNDYGSLSFYV
jgi:hypothetical protein